MADKPFETSDRVSAQDVPADQDPQFHIPEMAEASSQFFSQAWNGPRSDASFTASHENGMWLLGIRIDAETPIVLQSPHASVQLMHEHADMMDLGLAVARDPADWPDTDIAENALGLAYCRDFYRQNGQLVHQQIASAKPQMELTSDNLRRMRSNTRSADAMCRISERINSALTRVLDTRTLAHLSAPTWGHKH